MINVIKFVNKYEWGYVRNIIREKNIVLGKYQWEILGQGGSDNGEIAENGIFRQYLNRVEGDMMKKEGFWGMLFVFLR